MSVITTNSSTQNLLTEWKPILDGKGKDGRMIAGLDEVSGVKRAVTARLLENQEKSLLSESEPVNSMMSGQVATWDPVLISMVRRAVPKMIAFDIFGVQPMSAPTGLIFAMTTHYGPGKTAAAANEAQWHEADTSWSGKRTDMKTAGSPGAWEPAGGTGAVDPTDPNKLDPTAANVGYGIAMDRGDGELLGWDAPDGNVWNTMSFKITKTSIEAKSRALKTEWTNELTQDLKAVHGLDAETELSNILSTEIVNEINREMVRRMYVMAQDGAQDCTAPGVFDMTTDADGRWSIEKYKGLMIQLEREANKIAVNTRRGKGNFVVVSSDVASVLSMTGMLDTSGNRYGNFIAPDTQVDTTGTTYVGLLNGRMKVFVDPYVGTDFACVGFKGASVYEAGAFYAPYIPLQLYRAINPDTLTPTIGLKTRYGFCAHPMEGGNGEAGKNMFYRIFKITKL